MTVVLTVAMFVLTYALIATERVHRVYAALGGVAAMAVVAWGTPRRRSTRRTAASIAARHRHRISFWEFTRYGLAVTASTLVLAWPYVWLRYFAFG